MYQMSRAARQRNPLGVVARAAIVPDVPLPAQSVQTAESPSRRSTSEGSQAILSISGLRKKYGSTIAVEDVSFEVCEGEIFGLIGPNGAGKTTTMECAEGVRRPDRGTIRVLGLDPRRDAVRLQRRIGVQLQEAQLQKRIRVWEAVDLWASLYESAVDRDRLLEQLALTEKRNASFMSLSGGQKQRLFIALALINDPELVFLDELTTGLDPQARRAIWELVWGIRERGKTVFLTTHLMEEAERLCDRVAIIEHGKLIEVGAPEALVRKHCPERGAIFSCDQEGVSSLLRGIAGLESVHADGDTFTVQGLGDDFISNVIQFLGKNEIPIRDFRTVFPTLEDVFLKLTGHGIRD
jgi:ABC-2 type transport system ATP-binding protein